MKNIFTIFFSIFCLSLSAQTQQNINKTSGTVYNPISEIDSIRFDTGTNQMVVITTSGSESHALADITNVTFSNGANLTPCSGEITSVTDIDGNTYPVVQIGNQCWTAENLRTTKYNNGTLIPNVSNDQAWSNATTPAWCHTENNPAYDATFGKLYNWYTLSAGNMCPTGWHVPTYDEWEILINNLGGIMVAGGKMKSTGTQYWLSPNAEATNESGFSGLPGGYCTDNGTFSDVGSYGYWWSSTVSGTADAYCKFLNYIGGVANGSGNGWSFGFSVRCIRD